MGAAFRAPWHAADTLLETYRSTLDLLEAGRFLLIFPEDPSQSPDPRTKMSAFQKGFTRLGELYYQRTQRILQYYPVMVHAGERIVRLEGVLGVAEVVKGLHALSRIRPLPTKEREQYDGSRHLLVAEVAVALGVPPSVAEDYVDYALVPPAGWTRAAEALDLLVTDLAVFTVSPEEGLTLVELSPFAESLEHVRAATGCPFKVDRAVRAGTRPEARAAC